MNKKKIVSLAGLVASAVLFGFAEKNEAAEMHRVYNYGNGEHFYTKDLGEKNYLVQNGWKYEGIAWNAPENGIAVYRVYNPVSGEHHYTKDIGERNWLINEHKWIGEGIGWYSAPDNGVPIYRLYDPTAKNAGSHHYTKSEAERDYLVSLHWKYEGIAWYGNKEDGGNNNGNNGNNNGNNGNEGNNENNGGGTTEPEKVTPKLNVKPEVSGTTDSEPSYESMWISGTDEYGKPLPLNKVQKYVMNRQQINAYTSTYDVSFEYQGIKAVTKVILINEKIKNFDYDKYNQLMLQKVNDLRVSVGSEPLTYASAVQEGSDLRARDLAIFYGNGHTRPDGGQFVEAFPSFRETGIALQGENTAAFSNSNIINDISEENLAEQAFNNWKKSPGHYKNMIDSHYTLFVTSIYFKNPTDKEPYDIYVAQHFGIEYSAPR